MLQEHNTLVRKYFGPATLAMAVLLLAGNAAWADGNGQGNNGNGVGRRQWPGK